MVVLFDPAYFQDVIGRDHVFHFVEEYLRFPSSILTKFEKKINTILFLSSKYFRRTGWVNFDISQDD